MATDYVKRYFKRVNGRITTVNKQDPFSTSFLSSVAGGNEVLFQKHFLETRIFDGNWVDYVEENLRYVDNVIRNPRSFIKDYDEIVPIERAKRTTPESIRHLASHSYLVKSVSPEGEVTPKKILTQFKEEDLAIYENRFVKTLIDKLIVFVEKRYDTIQNLIGTDYLNKFHTKSSFAYGEMNFEYEMSLNVSQRIHQSEPEQKNHELLERVEALRKQIMGFTDSSLLRALKNAKPVFAPIQRTNILMQDSNYKKCYQLWLFLDSYGKLDYTLESSVSEDKFSDEYIENLRDLTLLSVSTILANDEDNLGDFKPIPPIINRPKKPKILSSSEADLPKTQIQMESELINEYYYQQARKLYTRRIEDRTNDGEPFHVALKDIYQSAFKITEAIFHDLMMVPDDIKDDPRALLRFNMRNQKALEQIQKYKAQDLKKLERQLASSEKKIEKDKAKLEGVRLAALDPEALLKEKEKIRLAKIKEIAKEKERLARLVEREEAKLEKDKEKALENLRKQQEREQEKQRLAQEKALELERIAKEKAKEKEKIAKEKAKEKERLQRQKQKEREREKLRKQKEREKEKARLAREREKEKERLAKEKAKEKEKTQTAKKKVTTKPKTTTAPVVTEEFVGQNIVTVPSDENENS